MGRTCDLVLRASQTYCGMPRSLWPGHILADHTSDLVYAAETTSQARHARAIIVQGLSMTMARACSCFWCCTSSHPHPIP
jgi:hypothetical protein